MRALKSFITGMVRAWGRRGALLSLGLFLLACADEGSSEPIAQTSQALSPSVAASLAHPEYDLNEPAGWWWMHDASAADIEFKRGEGYRLLSLDVIDQSPLRFSAAFIGNSGPYLRNGHGWDADMTEAELLAIETETPATRRVVSVAPYRVGTERRYAVAWIGADGRPWDLVLHETQANFQTAVSNFGGRVIDLAAQQSVACVEIFGIPICLPIANQYEVTAVMYQQAPTDVGYRAQTLGAGTAQVMGADRTQRVADFDSPFGTDFFVYVKENYANGAVGEQSWWVADLWFDDANNRAHPYSVAHAPARFGGRYGKLKGYDTANGRRWAGVLYDNGPFPTRGTNNAGNALLDQIDANVQIIAKRWGLPGATVAIANASGNLVHAKAYGHSNLQDMRPAEPTDLFRLASVSKAIAYSAVARLMREGTLTLNTRPFLTIFPNEGVKPGAADDLTDFTIEHLLEHSPGLDLSFNTNPSTPANWLANAQTRNAASQALFVNTPGAVSSYWNAHYQILMAVVEAVSGMDYMTFLQQKVFSPLGVRRIKFPHVVTAPDTDGLVQVIPYDRPEPFCPFWNPPVTNPPGSTVPVNCDGWLADPSYAGSGALAASPIDLVRWAVGLDGSRPGARSVYAAEWALVADPANSALWNVPNAGGGASPQHLTFFDDGAGNLGHNGYIPGDVHAEVVLLTNGVKYAFMGSSDNLGCPTYPTQGQGFGFVGDMKNYLTNVLLTQAASLPARDLFPDYITPPCNPDFHGLPVSEYLPCTEHLAAFGYYPTTLTASSTGAFLSASFKQVPPTLSGFILDEASYVDVTVDQYAQGVLPGTFGVITPGGVPYYTGIWTPIPGYGESFHAMTVSDYQTRWNTNYAAGYLHSDVFAYDAGSGLRVHSTWRQVPHDGYATWIDMDYATYLTRHAEYKAAGLELTHFTSFRTGGNLLHAAIWERTPGEYVLTRHTTGAQYQTEYDTRVAQGFVIHRIHSFDEDSYDVIWKRLSAAQSVFGFESTAGFQVVTGSATLSTSSQVTDGYGALSVAGGGYMEVSSPPFTTAQLRDASSSGSPTVAALDILIPTAQPSPWWIGLVQLYLQIPTAGINHQYIGQVELTALPRGRYVKVTFNLPTNVRNAIAGNHSNVRFFLGLNVNAGAPPFLFDHLRFY